MRSQSAAIWFMKLMRVASMALAAYLVSSADAMSMKMSRFPERTNGSNSSRRIGLTSSLSMPQTIRSGLMKSLTAAPSLRNSGLEQTWNRPLNCDSISLLTRPAVPTGTVLLVITTFPSSRFRPMVRAALRTCCRSAEPSSCAGVPTAMKITRLWRTAAPGSFVNWSRPRARFLWMSASSPGS